MKERLKAIRIKLGLSQADFARSLGVNQRTISVWERGEIIPESRVLAICKEFNVRREWLETGEGEMFEPVSDSSVVSFADQIVAMYSTLPPDLQEVWRDAAQKIIDAGNDPTRAAQDAEKVINQALAARRAVG